MIKYPKDAWHFKVRNGWYETYRNPLNWHNDLYGWLWNTFGDNEERWEQHGGGIKFRNESDVALFLLKWA
jgi:hypothetical protein